jgi:hypothetical protein
MANTEQLALLRDKGVTEWNGWRKAHPALTPESGKANLSRADLHGAHLSGADLRGADLSRVVLIATNLEDAILTGTKVYGISVWDVKLQNTVQTSLVITPHEQEITVDNLEVAQFIYLLLNNSKIRHVIDTITSKAVLILGRFTPERKTTLDALRDALRSHNYLPILFDFEKPTFAYPVVSACRF